MLHSCTLASNSCTVLICRVVTVSLYDLTQLTKPLKFYGHLDIHQKAHDEYVSHYFIISSLSYNLCFALSCYWPVVHGYFWVLSCKVYPSNEVVWTLGCF